MNSIIFHNCSAELQSSVHKFIDDWNRELPTINVKTSGSTGHPKIQVLQKSHMLYSAKATGRFFKLSKGDKALLCLPISAIAGKMMVVRSLVLGLELHVAEPTLNPLAEISEKFDFAAFTPLQIDKIIEKNPEKLQLIKQLIIGGAGINRRLWNQITEIHSGCYQSFGMTETISHIALRPVVNPEIPYELLDHVKMEESDRLVLTSPDLGLYSLETNDMIEWKDARHFNWLGRLDYVINSGGLKIHPEEIENKLADCITLPYFSIGVPDDQLGEKHVVCIEGYAAVNKSVLAKVLIKNELPKEIYFFKKFDYTHSGKVDKQMTIARRSDAKKQVL